MPAPPHSVGTATPMSPISPSCFTASRGKRCSSSQLAGVRLELALGELAAEIPDLALLLGELDVHGLPRMIQRGLRPRPCSPGPVRHRGRLRRERGVAPAGSLRSLAANHDSSVRRRSTSRGASPGRPACPPSRPRSRRAPRRPAARARWRWRDPARPRAAAPASPGPTATGPLDAIFPALAAGVGEQLPRREHVEHEADRLRARRVVAVRR